MQRKPATAEHYFYFCVSVTMSGTGGNYFEGFLLVARDSRGNRVGRFSERSNNIRTSCWVLYSNVWTSHL